MASVARPCLTASQDGFASPPARVVTSRTRCPNSGRCSTFSPADRLSSMASWLLAMGCPTAFTALRLVWRRVDPPVGSNLLATARGVSVVYQACQSSSSSKPCKGLSPSRCALPWR